MPHRKQYPRITIAGLKGGSGKTTLSLGLMSAWREKGLRITPFKKGPDYIDAGWLSAASQMSCYNLDAFMIGKEKIMASFLAHYGESDCAVIEGNRGLYDGMDADGTYSTAELAKALKSPVLLILDCTKMTRTSAAVVLGVQKFDTRVDIKGIVLNRIAGSRHEKIVTESINRYCGTPVLGAIPKLPGDYLSERHMGLTPSHEHPDVVAALQRAGEMARKYLDLEKILEAASAAPKLFKRTSGVSNLRSVTGKAPKTPGQITIGIVRDSAFQFYYPENFEELEKAGAILVEVSAISEKKLPSIDALYIGGGFPETNAIALAKNARFRASLKKAVEEGLPVYAECGGLMYLGKALVLEGRSYPMAGIFPVSFSLEKRPQAHGYTIVEVRGKNPYYKKGTLLRGHEFHYSRPAALMRGGEARYSFGMKRGAGIEKGKDGLCYKNVLATYTHLHAYGAPEWAEGLIRQARAYKRKRIGNG